MGVTPRLTHVAMHVRDLAATVAFYERHVGMRVAHRRIAPDGTEVVWLAEPGREKEFILVVVPGGPVRSTIGADYAHLGFALGSREEVDAIAERAETDGCLVWPPRQEPYPVGYYCGLRDPDGAFVEFSYGQPLGPGAGSGVTSDDDG